MITYGSVHERVREARNVKTIMSTDFNDEELEEVVTSIISAMDVWHSLVKVL
jgi:hypothetical protein